MDDELSHYTLFNLIERGESGVIEGVRSIVLAWSSHVLLSALGAWIMCLSTHL